MNGSFSKPKLVQVGLVVRDLDKTMQQFKLLLGAEPDRVIEKSPSAPGPKYYLGQEREDVYKRQTSTRPWTSRTTRSTASAPVSSPEI